MWCGERHREHCHPICRIRIELEECANDRIRLDIHRRLHTPHGALDKSLDCFVFVKCHNSIKRENSKTAQAENPRMKEISFAVLLPNRLVNN